MGNILIIEDEKNFSSFVCKMLEPYHSCFIASEWEEAIEVLAERKIDIALVDLRLPKVSGKNIVEMLSAEYPEIIPIIITAYENDWKETEAYSYGVYRYLIKGSFNPNELHKVVNNAMLEKMERSKNLILEKELKTWDKTLTGILQKQRIISSKIPYNQGDQHKEDIGRISKKLDKKIDLELLGNSNATEDIINVIGELASKESLDEVLDHVIWFIKKITDAIRISIMLLSDDGEYLYIKKAMGLSSDIIKGTKIKIGEKIAGKAFSNRKIISSSDRIFRGTYFNYKEKGPFLSIPIMNIPDVNNEKPIGVINITRKSTDSAFNEKEKRALFKIVRTFSIAIKSELRKIEIEKNSINTLILISNVLEAKDPYTRGHSERVGDYAFKIALKLGYLQEDSKFLKYAGNLHDIGKINIPDSILLKNGPLTEDEYNIMKKHPIASKEMVSHISLFRKIQGVFLHHHERMDGRGYPDGIAGNEIETGARILAVADAYDAMTSNRPYRNALSNEEAISRLISGKGTQFDPDCVDALIEVINDELTLHNTNQIK
ncbi:MAG: hypothetical protein DRP54_05255 [Spirochaetes bacterium]|nr:MAG: hypothetical protein DRP54_05255 [Spirochaetota bacterium]